MKFEIYIYKEGHPGRYKAMAVPLSLQVHPVVQSSVPLQLPVWSILFNTGNVHNKNIGEVTVCLMDG